MFGWLFKKKNKFVWQNKFELLDELNHTRCSSCGEYNVIYEDDPMGAFVYNASCSCGTSDWYRMMEIFTILTNKHIEYERDPSKRTDKNKPYKVFLN